MPGGLQLNLLGRPHVRHDDTQIDGFVSSKAQALLYYVAVLRRPHARQSLAALLWGDMPEADARANLRVVLSNLRQICPHHLIITRDSVAFNAAAPYWLDVEWFQHTLGQLALPLHGAATRIQEAVELYVGDFLEGFNVRDAPEFETWVLLQRERLRQIALQALHTLTLHCTEQGYYSQGIAYATQLLALDPWREEAHRQLMLLLSLDGQRGAALAQYRTCQRVLEEELGVAPLAETTALYEHIRAAAPTPAPPPAWPALPLVGRGTEHAWLVRQWQGGQRPESHLTLVEGAAGTGKTRLAEEVLRYAQAHGAAVYRVRCQEFATALPFGPLADLLRTVADRQRALLYRLPDVWLAELARLLPEIHEHAPDPIPVVGGGDEMARQRLFEAVVRLFVALGQAPQPQPLVVLLDDLHWADPATLDLLRYLTHRLPVARLWLLGTYRAGQLDPQHPLLALRHALGYAGRMGLLQLGPLPDDAIASVATGFTSDAGQATALAALLARQSGGNPFVLQQIVHDLAQRQLLYPQGAGWRLVADWPAAGPGEPSEGGLPFGVRELLLDQISRLAAPARRLLQLVALAVPPLDTALLGALCEAERIPPQSVLACLEARMLVCVDAGSYGLPDERLRGLIAGAMAPDLRQHTRAVVEAARRCLRGQEAGARSPEPDRVAWAP